MKAKKEKKVKEKRGGGGDDEILQSGNLHNIVVYRSNLIEITKIYTKYGKLE